jgi:hypothetical protein
MSASDTAFLLSFTGAVFYTLKNAQKYWVFGLGPSTSILETRKHNVSETGSVSILR